jgi:MSHA pilin protein MshA
VEFFTITGGCNRVDSTNFDTEVSDMSKHQRGFTLIELIVVIVILGILAATALPRFVNLQSDAKAATMQGLAGGLRAAVELVRGRWLVTGSTTATTVTTADGTPVTVGTAGAAAGVPVGTALGIGNAVGTLSGYTPTYGSPTTFVPSAGPPTCVISYDPTTGAVNSASAVAASC